MGTVLNWDGDSVARLSDCTYQVLQVEHLPSPGEGHLNALDTGWGPQRFLSSGATALLKALAIKVVMLICKCCRYS